MRTIPALAAALLLAGCAGGGEAGETAAASATSGPPPPSAAADTGWTAGVVERARPDVRMTTLAEVRAAAHPGYDRVVFQLSDGELPGYRVEYIDRPVRLCGSGEAVEVAGDGWLSVRLEPARAHDERGNATVTDRRRSPGLALVRELRSTCDFEGQVEWVLGVAAPNPFRVLELSDPARLVVDVRR